MVLGRVVRAEKHKQVTFVWCWRPPDLVQCVIPQGTAGPKPPVGSFVRLTGRYQEYGGQRADCLPVELLTEQVEILSVPAVQHPGQGLEGLRRSRTLFARALAIATAHTFLSRAGLLRVEAPLVAGPEAAAGATLPFRLCAGRRHVYLTVNGITGLHEHVAAGLPRVYQFSRLYWGHHSADRSYLTEINLIEVALAGAGREGVTALAERLIESIRMALSGFNGLGDSGTLDTPLTGLPMLTHAQLADLTAARTSGHVVSRAAAEAVMRELGAPGFWLADPPAASTPHYVRAEPGPAGPHSVAVELHLAGVGESASGSEWITNPAQARATTAGWRRPGTASRYLAAIDRGIPAGTAGMSLGLDRLLMHLLGLQRAASVVPTARNSATFRSAVARVRMGGRPAVRTARPLPAAALIAQSSRRICRAVDWLLANGFLECVTSLLWEPWAGLLPPGPPQAARSAELPAVDYFGRRVCLVPRREPAHHRHLSECPAPIFEIGPVARGGRRWASPAWTLTASWIDPGAGEAATLAERLIRLLATEDDAGTAVTARVRPLRPGRPGYFRGSLTGRGLTAMTWSVGGRVVADAGTWVASAGDVPDALGDSAALAPLREFLASGPPPAGSVTVNLTALPGLGWPPFAANLA